MIRSQSIPAIFAAAAVAAAAVKSHVSTSVCDCEGNADFERWPLKQELERLATTNEYGRIS